MAAADYSDRAFVIKFLSPEHLSDEETKRRFEREAEAASELHHRNICYLLDKGVYQGRPYILMEYVKGETLRTYISRGRINEFDLKAWLDIAIQLTEGLLEAHKRGITHRDIKPENIMITPERVAKILDWGLAKLPEPSIAADAREATTKLTKPEELLGTDPYMSPEQARRESVDKRSDIFSFGVVLYEIFSGGINPFDRGTREETFDAIKTQEPKSLRSYNPALPRQLIRIVDKTLKKDMKDRYQKTEKLLADLKNLKEEVEDRSIITRVKHHPRLIAILSVSLLLGLAALTIFLIVRRGRDDRILNSIAILPLVNKSADLNMKYLCDQITDNLINNLTRVSDLRVTSRDTAFRFDGQQGDPQRVGRDLQVRTVLTGTVSSQGGKLILRLSTTRTSDGIQGWGDFYEWEQSDVVAAQRSINKASEDLATELTGKNYKFPWRHIIANTEAYNLYSEGRFYLGKRNVVDINKSIGYFERSLEKDPQNALAYVGIADAYILLGSQGYSAMRPTEALPKARKAVLSALEIDSSMGEGTTSLALIRMLDWDWTGAENEFKRAISLNPGYATAHHWYANYLIAQNRGKEAEHEIAIAQQLEPNSFIISATIGWISYFEGHYDDAIAQCKKTLDKQGDFYPAHAFLAFAYEQKGDLDSALQEFQVAKKISNDNPVMLGEIARIQAKNGDDERAQKGLNKLLELRKVIYVPADTIALIYGELDDNDEAFAWLTMACDEHAVGLALIKVEPKFKKLQADSRFRDVMRRMGLTE